MTVPDGPRGRTDDRGLWRDLRGPRPAGPPRPALFLDRDGTVIEEVPYLSDPALVRPIAQAMTTIVRANTLGIPVVVVTSQSGLARGYFDRGTSPPSKTRWTKR